MLSEVITLTVRAFNLAEKYRTPVILLMDAMSAGPKSCGRSASRRATSST